MEGVFYTNKDKLNNYNLTGSLHTLEIKSPAIIKNIDENIKNCVEGMHTKFDENDEKNASTKMMINPNKLQGDVLTFSDFRITFDTILAGAGVNKYNIIRADMRFDNYDENCYKKYMKFNKYLISMLAVTYNVKNVFETKNLFTDKTISIAIKNRFFEIENYNRKKKNEITGNKTEPVRARLEERSVSRQWQEINKKANKEPNWNMDALKKEFTETWFDRWDKALKNLDKVQNKYNDELEKKYFENKNARPVQFRNQTEFIMQHQNSIFTKKQLINLFARFGAENPENKAKNYKQNYGIEFFSQADVRHAVNEIKRAALAFFGS